MAFVNELEPQSQGKGQDIQGLLIDSKVIYCKDHHIVRDRRFGFQIVAYHSGGGVRSPLKRFIPDLKGSSDMIYDVNHKQTCHSFRFYLNHSDFCPER